MSQSPDKDAIDRSVLDMMNTLKGSRDSDHLALSITEIQRHLVDIQSVIYQQKPTMLEQISAELANFVIQIGAIGMLRLVFELQSLGKMGTVEGAEVLLEQIRTEFQKAKLDLGLAS